MKAAELMTRDPVTLDATASIGDAIALVSEYGVRHVPILRNGALIGVLSDRDLRPIEGMLAVDALDAARVEARLAVPVTAILQGTPVTVEPSASLATVIDRMLDEHVGAVVVVGDKDDVLGIVSYVDVLSVARSLFERRASEPPVSPKTRSKPPPPRTR